MNPSELISLASSEEFLRTKGILQTFHPCPFCGSSFIGRVRRNFIKGCSCKKDSILENLQAPFYKLVLAIKPFLLKVKANKTHREREMTYSTAYKAYHKIRKVIYHFVKEEVEDLRAS